MGLDVGAPIQGVFPRNAAAAAAVLGLMKDLRRDFGASGSSSNTTGTIAAGSTILTLATAADFENGQGIAVYHAGPGPYQVGTQTPLASAAAPTVTVQGTTGATTYKYYVLALDDKGGVAAASPAGEVTTGNATLNQAGNYNLIEWAAVTGAAGYAILGDAGNPASSQGILGVTMETSFQDTGRGPFTQYVAAPYIPTTPNASPLGQTLVCSIVSGAGTTQLVLSQAASSSVNSTFVQHDDSSAVNAALSYSSKASAPVHVPSGAYMVNTPLNEITGNYGFLFGDGAYSSTFYFTGGMSQSPMLSLYQVSLWTFQDVGLVGDNTVNVLSLNGTFNCMFANVRLACGYPTVLITGNSGDNHFVQCRFQDSQVAILTESLMNYISQSNFDSNDIHVTTLSGNNTSGLRIDGCTFAGGFNGEKATYGIWKQDSYGEFSVHRCWFQDMLTAVALDGGYGCSVIASRVAATNVCIRAGGVLPVFMAVTTAADGGAVPTEYYLGATGTMILNPMTTIGYTPSMSNANNTERIVGHRFSSQVPAISAYSQIIGRQIAEPSNVTATNASSGTVGPYLAANTTYTYGISASGEDGVETTVATASVTTGATAYPVNLSWTPPAGASYIHIYRDNVHMADLQAWTGTTYQDTGNVNPSGRSPAGTNLTGQGVFAGLQLTNPISTTSAVAGTASALPSAPAGYIQVMIGGTNYLIPFYNT